PPERGLRARTFAFLSTHWPPLLALLFIVLLPVGRQIEISITLFAFSLAFLARNANGRHGIRQAAGVILPLFLCVWVPMLLSSLDSLDPAKSWKQTLPSMRFLATTLAIAVWMQRPGALALFQRLACWLLLFWAADGYVQLAFGRDIFGIPMHEDRLNALFFDSYFAYGPTLAILSPVAIDHMRRHWPGFTWLAGFAFILGAVLISGMRAAWVMMGVVMVAFMVVSMRGGAAGRRQALLLPLAAVLALALAMIASPLLKERLQLSTLAAQGTEQALDEASSYRLPIFRNAWAMYLDHPINGIGVRAMRAAYPMYADPDDPHIVVNPDKVRAHQAHNIVLEFMTDMGTIGLIGLIAAWSVAWRFWRSLDQSGRGRAFPYAAALLAVAFPLNSYFAFFGVYLMSITWFLVGLMLAAAHSDPR
ncbi:MAG: O-antigen ligase family protein, partial [Xanthomonadales bacterium]|nr:O-antigen ligase family protein [Xanthomonadales bacterium]